MSQSEDIARDDNAEDGGQSFDILVKRRRLASAWTGLDGLCFLYGGDWREGIEGRDGTFNVKVRRRCNPGCICPYNRFYPFLSPASSSAPFGYPGTAIRQTTNSVARPAGWFMAWRPCCDIKLKGRNENGSP